MDEHQKPSIARRDVLRAVALVAVAAGTSGAASNPADAPTKKDDRGKRKSQYQPNAAEVRTFYRVNSYPPK